MSAAHPLLSGTHGPITDESVFDDLPVIGEVPADLNGAFFRNGPNAHYPPPGRYHWFDGDGMIHAVYFDRGRVTYRNRYVRTACFQEEEAAGRALWPGIMDPPRRDRPDMPLKDTSNTDVKFHAGRLVTMWYLGGRSRRSARPTSREHCARTFRRIPRWTSRPTSSSTSTTPRPGRT